MLCRACGWALLYVALVYGLLRCPGRTICCSVPCDSRCVSQGVARLRTLDRCYRALERAFAMLVVRFTVYARDECGLPVPAELRGANGTFSINTRTGIWISGRCKRSGESILVETRILTTNDTRRHPQVISNMLSSKTIYLTEYVRCCVGCVVGRSLA